MMRSVNFPAADFESLIGALSKKIKSTLEFIYPIARLRRACKYVAESEIYETQDGCLVKENSGTPKWAKNFYYLNREGEFYDLKSHASYATGSLDIVYSRYLMTKQDITDNAAKPQIRPTDFLSNVIQVPHYESLGYFPGAGKDFSYMGIKYLNTYREEELSDKCTAEEYDMVRRL